MNVRNSILDSKSFRKRKGIRPDYYVYVLETIKNNCIDGLWMEFGVAEGDSIQWLAMNAPMGKMVYGFDSFEGIPEDFYDGKKSYPAGTFKINDPYRKIRQIEAKLLNVRIIEGMFQDTLVPFLRSHSDNCAVIHMDCDLYSSTSYVLQALKDRIVPGTYILFDEIRGGEDISKHEAKAFYEFIMDTGLGVSWIAHVSNAPQATCVILEKNST